MAREATDELVAIRTPSACKKSAYTHKLTAALS